MHLVLMIAADRVIHVKAFSDFDLAKSYANQLVTERSGASDAMPDWELGPYRTVFTSKGVSIMIEPCNEPEMETV